jgi:outer membrane protein assembly factor BamD
MLLESCSEYSNVLKSNDYEYRYEAAKALYADGHYRQAAELFSLLLAPLKGTSYGEESLYMLGESNLKAKDYESAVMFFKKYYQLYPKGSYMELSRYNTGYSLYKQTPDIRLDQSSTMEAIKEFQNFLDYCPETTLKEQAHQIIYDMQDKLVQKEYQSAKLYYDLGTYTLNCIYGGNNYEACVVTAQNALKDYPYASANLREELSILTLRAKYHLARQSVEERRLERFRDAIDEYYAFQNDYPESKYLKEATSIRNYSERVIANKGQLIDDEDIVVKEKTSSKKQSLPDEQKEKKDDKPIGWIIDAIDKARHSKNNNRIIIRK